MLRKLLLSAVVSMTCNVALANESHYFCKPSIIGCRVEYTGPVDRAAAEAYFADAKSASEWVVDTFPTVKKAHFVMKDGEVVVQMLGTNRLNNHEVRQVAAHFFSKHLFVREIVLMDEDMTTVIGGKKFMPQNGGEDRFSKVRNIKVAANAVQNEDAMKAQNPVRKNQWGDVFIKVQD